MDEGTDENNKELKPREFEDAKVESSSVSPVIGLSDVTELHHDSESGRRASQKNDEYHSFDPVDARHLDNVYQYASRIRQFIGLPDPNENLTIPVSSSGNELVTDKLNDKGHLNLEESDLIPEKLPDFEKETSDPIISVVDVPTSNNSDVNETAVSTDEQSKLIEENLTQLEKETTNPPRTDNDIPTSSDPKINKTALPTDESNKTNEKLAVLEQETNNPSRTIPTSDDPYVNETALSTNGNNDEQFALYDDKEIGKSFITEENKKDEENETVSLQLSEDGGEYEQQKLQPILKAVKNLSNETNEISSNEGITQTLLEYDSLELTKKNENMPNHIDDKLNNTLLEPEVNDICSNGVDLNKVEKILSTEETTENDGDSLERKENLDPNNYSLISNDKTKVGLEESETPKRLDEPNFLSNRCDQNISSTQDGNFENDNGTNLMSNELYTINEDQDSLVPSDEIEEIPHFENIRRLSVEIVNKVLDTAGTQLKDILNEKRKSNADANNILEHSLHLDITSAHAEAVKSLNSECVNASYDEDSNNLASSEERCIQLIGKSEIRPKLNNEVNLKDVLEKTYDSNDFQKKIEVEMNKFDPKYDVDPDIVCGMGCFKPKWIQPYATSGVYLILYSIIGILSGSYYSYLIGSISSLEKRFSFKSKTSGYVMMLDEITPLFLGIFIGYFGGKSHRPRMVGLGMLMSSLACFISALPYFIYGPATHLSLGYSTNDNEKKLELCNAGTREEFCDKEDRLPTLTPILLLMFGSFLKGFGNLAYYAIGLAYMDDNSKKKNTPMYFAIAFSLRLLGPMVGFLMSSFFLKFYENPFVDPGFGPSDPRWIGCWWMGFLVQGVLLTIFTIPISLFPRRLPGTVDYTKSEGDQPLVTSFVGLIAALKRLAKNPVYCLIVLNAIMGIMGAFGHYINLPRYMENQFRLSASTSNLISGPPSLGAVMISMTIGGYLIWKFKPGAKFLAGALSASHLLQVCAYLVLMIPTCPRIEMTSYGLNNDGLILQTECNNNCNCSTSTFSPVCGPDGATIFFSPCHAGCTEKGNGTYLNCSCVFDSSGKERNYVTEGFCVTDDCWPSILAYILTMPAVQLIVNLAKVGHTMIFLRSIKPEDKSVALGTFEAIICLFGFIPYPIVYGALVDSACLIWEETCGESGNCWYYDVPMLNYLIHGTSALFTTLDACTLIGIFFLASRVHDLYKEDYGTKTKPNVEKNEPEIQREKNDSTSISKL